MQVTSARIGRSSLWSAVRDARVRAGVYLWFLIAGLCAILANAVAAGM